MKESLKHIINLQMLRLRDALKIVLHKGEISDIKLMALDLQVVDMLINHIDIARGIFEHCEDFIKKEMPDLYKKIEDFTKFSQLREYRLECKKVLDKIGFLPVGDSETKQKYILWPPEKSDSIKTIEDIKSAINELLDIENPEILAMNFSVLWIGVDKNIKDEKALEFFKTETDKFFPYIRMQSLSFTKKILKTLEEKI